MSQLVLAFGVMKTARRIRYSKKSGNELIKLITNPEVSQVA